MIMSTYLFDSGFTGWFEVLKSLKPRFYWYFGGGGGDTLW
jgi:hypothetical protein